MKKLIFAIILLMLILAAGIAEQIYLNNLFDELEGRIDGIITAMEDGQEVSGQTKELSDWWGKKHRLIEALVNHGEIKEITLLVAEIQGYSEADMTPDLHACVVRLLITAKHVRHLLEYRPEHIF